MIELADTPLSPRTIQKEEPIYASYRSYETVMEALKIPRNYFTPGLRVLSVGEGLSDFARRLAEKGVDVLALDPIYMLGKKFCKRIRQKCQENCKRLLVLK